MHPPSTLPSARLFARVIAAAVALLLVAAGVVAAGATRALAAVTLPATLIDTASTWRYSDDNSDPAKGDADRLVWAKAGYDDSGWKSASGAFGAKNGKATGIGANFPIATLLNQYIDGVAAPDVKTFHFRSSFDLTAEQLAAVSGLGATITYDDAIQVFVNGSKVAGFVDSAVEAAPEEQRNLMYAGANGGDPVTSTFTIPASALSAGTNTIAIALYQDRATSSDIYLDVKEIIPLEADVPAALDDIVLTIGADESSRNLTWYTNRDTTQVAQLAKKSEMAGNDFPATARSIAASGAATTSGEFNRRAELTGLAENTEYVYRVGSAEDGWSAASTFRTGAFSGDYDFLFVGDPQIGASGNVANDQAGWADTLDVAQRTYPDAELLFSAGDQVESAGNENHYAAFLAPEQLRQLPLVPVNGNHDVGSKAYEQHYTVPNLDSSAGAATSGSSSGGDYWFEYKDVLFMVINSNSRDYSTHVPFLEKVVAEHGATAKWKVLAFHHSIYSVASHVNDSSIQDLRANLPGTISDLGIDLVLQGHDHSYTRSFLVKDGALATPPSSRASRPSRPSRARCST
ncbi:fibronectin type III domain-containing protein [Leifsonia sp. NPDC058194]|uniref:fibronectin type III domain-containing protein n=1 Tax=Leifsonia sp. NPDC058194 TaxID=3346374 RepID=UPI0036DA4ABD